MKSDRHLIVISIIWVIKFEQIGVHCVGKVKLHEYLLSRSAVTKLLFNKFKIPKRNTCPYDKENLYRFS